MKTIKIGIVGGRGISTVMGLKAMEDVEITAFCNLDEGVLKQGADMLGDVKTYRIYEDMLESDIDAVVIATPMQCHVPQAIAALEAGKHVMSEVTAGVSMDELWWLCESVEKYKGIYMLAENYIYTPQVQMVKEMVKKGLFGDPYYVECMYLHNIDGLFKYHTGKTSWRSYWQCGKRGNFYPTHSLGPAMTWLYDDRITEISTFSPGIRNELGLKQDSGTTTMCRTEKGRLIELRTDCLSPRPHNMTHYQLQGTKGIFQSNSGLNDNDKVSFIGEDNPMNNMKWELLDNYKDYLPERYKNATEEQNNSGHGGGDFFIVEDFINAIRTGVQPEIDVYKACEWTAVGLLSALSVTNNGKTIEVPHFRPNVPDEEKFIKL